MQKILITLILFLAIESQIFAVPVADIFLKRKSGKDYDPNLKVTKEQLLTCAEAARWSPSSHNNQPWHFIICDKEETPEAYQNVLNSLKGSNPTWAQHAPILIIISTSYIPSKKDDHQWAQYDTGAAALSWSLQATELGLMCHQLGGFDPDKIRSDFQIPEEFTPTVVMTLGYEAAESKERNRVRHPVEENFDWGVWGNGLKVEY